MSMIYSLDSANVDVIEKAIKKFPVTTFSMNPSIAARDLKDNKEGFFESLREIRNIIGEESEFYVQVVGETVEQMVKDAEIIKENVTGNLFIKIPACVNGFKAIQILKNKGYNIACTAVMDVNQALLAATAGADIIAVYVSRINKNGGDGVAILKNIVKAYRELKCDVKVSAASIKDPLTVEKVALVGVSVVALSYELLELCADHPLTEETLDGFRRDWESTYGKGRKLSSM